MAGLRERNKIRAMRELQAVALDLFTEEGFDAVTVEDVAAAGAVSPSTIYRYFGNKERLVVWDEADRDITVELTQRLGKQEPMLAVRDSLIAAFADIDDEAPLLRRVRFIYATPQVHAAAVEQELADEAKLAAAFAAAGGRRQPNLEDSVYAGACMAALGAAIEHWQSTDGKHQLPELIAQAFGTLTARGADFAN